MRTKRFYITLVFALLMSCFSVFAQSDKQKALEIQRQQKLKELKQLNALLFSNKKEEKSVITLIEDINKDKNKGTTRLKYSTIKAKGKQAKIDRRKPNGKAKTRKRIKAA